MSKPKYCLRLTGFDLAGQNISCTGEQLVLVLDSLDVLNTKLHWYAADVVAIDCEFPWSKSETPISIGDTSMFIELSKKTGQFLSGVFLATLSTEKELKWKQLYNTEDELFRSFEFSEVEIRMFDTTYIEIYCSNSILAEKVARKFSIVPISNDRE